MASEGSSTTPHIGGGEKKLVHMNQPVAMRPGPGVTHYYEGNPGKLDDIWVRVQFSAICCAKTEGSVVQVDII